MSDLPDNVIPLSFGEPAAPTVGPPPPELFQAALEACLFANPAILTENQLSTALRSSPSQVREALLALQQKFETLGSGIRLIQAGEGWQLRTDARLSTWVAAIRGVRPFKLSRAALETLAVIAYRQPVSKGVVDEIRGVDCGGVLRMLLERGLVRSVGRSDEPGHPLSYSTTPAFLHTFGIRSLSDLPTLRDLRALSSDDAESANVLPFGESRDS